MNNFFPKIMLSLLAVFVIVLSAKAATTRPAHDSKVWEKDIAAFEAADQKDMPATGGVVFVGSSSIRIWKVAKAFPGENVINRGFGGSWACDSAYYADRIVIPYKPRTIVFYAGDNDINAGASAEFVADSFKQFVKKVHAALPNTKIVFISIKPCPARWRFWKTNQAANALVAKFAHHTADVSFVDVTHEMLGPDGKPRPELFQKDGLHMNPKGYAIWNKKVRPFVENGNDAPMVIP
jgi:lysophospholipase L1-like esterase